MSRNKCKMKISDSHKDDIINMYMREMKSPNDIAAHFGYNRTQINEFLRRRGMLRNMSEAGKIAARQGKKDKAISALILSAKTDNRFNPLKSVKGEKHGSWIADRSKLKQQRNRSEERWFFSEVIKERGYKCELTQQGGKLSVHHIKGVWSSPELRFSKENCIVVLKHIHIKFHKIYGLRTTEDDWSEFVSNGEYKDDYLTRVKKLYVPFEDKTGKRYGRLVAMKKVGRMWECKCDCGNLHLVYSGNLSKGSTKSCGCLDREVKRERASRLEIWKYSSRSNKTIQNATI